MRTRKIIMAGFGGQGVMAMGQLVTYAGMLEGKQVSWLPSYGPEMRGGSANCSVIVSEEPVGAPVFTQATDVIVMNGPSYDKFASHLIPGGNLFINASLVKPENLREDVNVYQVPVNDIAKEIGNNRVANMVMLGAFLDATNIASRDSVIKAFTKVYGDSKKKLLPINEKALQAGAERVCEGGQCVILTNVKPEDLTRTPKANTVMPGEKVDYLKSFKESYSDTDAAFNNELSIVKEAILNVTEGIKFYEMAAKQFEGTETAEIFTSLATQKKEHILYLKQLQDKINREDNKSGIIDSIKNALSGKGKLNWGELDPADASMAISVLSVGMTISQRGIEFYKKAVENSRFQPAKDLYNELIYWEGFHYDQLKGQYELYKEQWWSDQMFSKM